ncbi:MAG: GatB/YqeY domain-containing protein [Anaerolineales bacterium]
MSLREQLQSDLQDAIRARDERRKAALRMVLLNVQMAEVEQGALPDEEIIVLIQKEVKRREEALELVREAGREDLLETDAAEIEILKAYLPEPLSREAIVDRAKAVIAELGAESPRDMGQVMGVLMPQLRGMADGRLVSTVVRELLSS